MSHLLHIQQAKYVLKIIFSNRFSEVMVAMGHLTIFLVELDLFA